MSIGHRKKVWKRIGISVLIFITVSSIGLSVWGDRKLKNCMERKDAVEAQLESYQKQVYVAAEKFTKGTVISEDKVRAEIIYTELPEEAFISDEDFGKTVITDVAEGTWLLDYMFCSGEENKREVFLSEIEIAEHLQPGDRIDVRIRYCNAEDYIVLSDKILKNCASGMVLELSEMEILLISSAITDSQNYENTRLYAVEYPEYQQTEPGEVTYIANKEILRMLGREKTDEEERLALEQRLERAEK